MSDVVKLHAATIDQKVVLKNLMQLYMHDFSEFVDIDVEANGLFPEYPMLDLYWTEPEQRFPYLISKDNNLVGFVLVRIAAESDNRYSIAEFFVLRKYRRAGIGKQVALQLFHRYKGPWEVHQRENNVAAQLFWIKVIATFTNGNFTDQFDNGKRVQLFTSAPGQ